MNCEHFETLIGMRCNPLGRAVEVVTPFTFPDGGALELFAEGLGPQVLFFDDGFTLMHLHSIGIDLGQDRRAWKPLNIIAEAHGVTLSNKGVFEVLCPSEAPSLGFARLVSTLLAIGQWANDQRGLDQDADWFVEEVAMYLRAWKQGTPIIGKPSVKGLSGRLLHFHFQIGKQYVDAIQPSAGSTGAELRKIVDLTSGVYATTREAMVVVDDRSKPEIAKQEMGILGQVASVWPMTRLIEAAGGNGVPQ